MDRPYVELVFLGSKEALRRLAAELSSGTGDELLISREVGIEGDARAYRVLAAIGLSPDHVHALAPASVMTAIRDRLSKPPELGLAIEAAHDVDHLEFAFSFDCFNPESARRVREIFENPVPGADVDEFAQETIADESAEGIELYSPVHRFEYRGRGVVRGAVLAVVSMRKKAESEPLINAEKMRIVLGAETAPAGGGGRVRPQ